MRTMQQNPIQRILIQNVQYTITNILGSGTFGTVYLGENRGNKYAIKEQKQMSQTELEFTNFMKSKSFKNLVNIVGFEIQQDKIYIVMEYCTISLFDKIQQKTIATQDIRYVMKEIANGIKELHDLGLAHRDLKPENILIQERLIEQRGNIQERYKICDFGTIKNNDLMKTKKVGTPYYLAPEQLDGNSEKQSIKVDIWSFGALCFELLTNTPLFNGITLNEIETKIKCLNINKEIDGLSGLEVYHKDLLKRMLQRNPNDRCNIDYVITELSKRGKSIQRDQNVTIQKQTPIVNFSQQTPLQKQAYTYATLNHQKQNPPFPQSMTLQKSPQPFQMPQQFQVPVKTNQYNYIPTNTIQNNPNQQGVTSNQILQKIQQDSGQKQAPTIQKQQPAIPFQAQIQPQFQQEKYRSPPPNKQQPNLNISIQAQALMSNGNLAKPSADVNQYNEQKKQFGYYQKKDQNQILQNNCPKPVVNVQQGRREFQTNKFQPNQQNNQQAQIKPPELQRCSRQIELNPDTSIKKNFQQFYSPQPQPRAN